MAVNARSPFYRIYLLTVWQTQDQEEAGDAGWRFHLTNPQTGKRYGFTSPETLLALLQKILRKQPPVNDAL